MESGRSANAPAPLLPITLDLDRYRPRLERAPCTACDGKGTIDAPDEVAFPGLLVAQRRCPACGGRGKVGTRVVVR
jgi:hypothetical protein